MAGKKNIIGIKFGVDPESAGLIKSQLEDIASKIQIDVNVNESHFSAQLKKLKSQLQKELGDISINLTTRTATQGKRGGSSGATDAEKLSTAYKSANTALTEMYSIKTKLLKLKENTHEYVKNTQLLSEQESIYNEQLKLLRSLAGVDDERLKNLSVYQAKLDAAYKNQKSESNLASSLNIEKLALKAQGLSTDKGFDKIIERSKEARDMVSAFQKKVIETLYDDKGAPKSVTNETIKQLNTELFQTEKKLKEIGERTDTVGSKIKEAFDAHFIHQIAQWLMAAMVRAIKQVYDNVLALDKAVTNLQIATGGTREEAQALIGTYAQLAKQLGATTIEVADAADTWLRQGYSIAEANELITYTMMLSKLGQLSSADAAKALTSAMRGYKVEVQDTLKIVDKLTAVDMEAAVSAGGIATAMAETAAGAEIAGVSMDKLIGYIATVAEVTQDAEESVGTYFRTLFSRMGRVAEGADIDDEGEDISDVESVLSSLGIVLRKSSGEFRNFGDVLDEVGGKWDEFNSVQQRQLAGAFAGMRQQEKFIVLMENYGDALDYANTAGNSAGTAQSKFDAAYMDSIEAKINRLTATWQDFSQNLLDSSAIKIIVDILNGLASALTWIITNIDILSIGLSYILSLGIVIGIEKLIPLIKSLGASFGELGKNIKNVFTKTFSKDLQKIAGELKKTQGLLDKNNEAFEDFADTTDYSAETLSKFYEAGVESGDVTKYLSDTTNLTAEQQERLITLSKENTKLTAQQRDQTDKLNASMKGLSSTIMLLSGIASLLIGIFSSMDNSFGQITSLILSLATIVVIVVLLIHKTVKVGVKNILTELAKLNSNVWIAIITAILTAIMALINAISWLVNSDARAKDAAKESAKASQEQADALREVSDAAKEASESISNLCDEIKKTADAMSNSEWLESLNKLGEGINDLYSDEELTPLQGINKLLGTAYTYQDLINKSAQERLDLLDDINEAQLKETRNAQRATYEKQKAASTETTNAAGMRERIKTKGSYVVDEFINEIYKGNEDGIDLDNTGGKNFKVTVNSTSSQDFVNKVKKITDAYEEKYKYNLAALQDNEVYQYFSGLLAEGQEALKTQTSDFLNYLSTSVQSEGLKVRVDLDAENAQAEYDRILQEIVGKLKQDSTINVALTEGLIKESDLSSYATEFIAKNYKELYNRINPQTVIVSFKKLETMLKEVEGEFDILSDAMEDMSERGILSADTIKTLKEEFPELMEYVQETAEGFVLMDGALSSYLNGISAGYMDAVRQAQEYFDTVYAAYEASSEKTIEQYQIVVEAQNNLNNAIKNAENWRITEATLTKDGLIEQYTELLEEQQDALDEQCDKYKELCDIRKDLLETYQEELDYQRKLADKQKNVADLQTQLAMAKLDNSAAGKAKQRELQAQLDEANEELNEYTLEHAIEDITKDIEEAESAYEDFIQAKIDEISSKIESIVSMSTQEISSAITALGERPIVLDTGDGSTTSTSGGYNDVINSGKESAGQTISDATVAPPEETEPVFLTSGKLSSGVSIGGGLSGLANNARHNDDVDVTIGGSTYDLLAGSVADSKIVHKLNSLNGGSASAGDIVAYDGALYIYDKKGDWRKMADDHSSASSAAAKYLQLLNEQETHHTGGFAGNVTDLKSNEVFAKLLKGELVSTPEQMDNFIKTILPSIVMRASQGDTFEYNAPLFEIHCGNIDKDTLPDLETIINKAVEKFERRMGSALSRTGHKKNFNK